MKEEKEILYIDDEQANLDVLQIAFNNLYTIHTTTSVTEAWEILNTRNIKVFISDQKMPEILGLDLIKQVNKTYPDIVSILLTAFSDKEILLDSINNVGLFRYILKPWKGDELVMTLNNAFEKYELTRERKKLLEDMKKQNEQLVIEKRKAEESARLKAAFLGNISHEFRTPMNGIMGFSELLLQDGIDSDLKHTYSKLLNTSIKNLLSILDDIILISEIQAEIYECAKRKFSISKLEEDFNSNKYRILQKHNKESLEIKASFIDNGFKIYCSFECLSQLLEKLIDNAVKFTDNGHIQIDCYLDEVETPLLHINVSDTGVGIPKEKLQSIFNVFYQINSDEGKLNSGNGIGLSIVKSLTELLHGKIELESSPGKGSSFKITIPLPKD